VAFLIIDLKKAVVRELLLAELESFSTRFLAAVCSSPNFDRVSWVSGAMAAAEL